jgi:hypothetical protein
MIVLVYASSRREFEDRHTNVVDLAAAGVDGLEQLVNLIVAHLLTQVGQDWRGMSVTSSLGEFMFEGACHTVSELTDTDEASHVFVKDLETAAVLLRLTGVAETTSAVEDF